MATSYNTSKDGKYAAREARTREIVADALVQFDNLPDSAGVREPVACGMLACSPATVWRLAKAGTIKAHKISARVTIFNVGSIRAVLNSDTNLAK